MAKRGGSSGTDKTFWMVTFSDLLSLMLTFFVLLLSMSQMDEKRLKEIAESFHAGVGVLERGGPFGIWIRPKEMVSEPQNQASYRERMERLHENLRARIDKEGPKVKIGTNADTGALKINLDAEYMFPSGSAQLSERAQKVLRDIGVSLRHVSGRFEIAGHTDNVPIRKGTGWKEDNWALSLARSISVAGFLVRELGVSSRRLAVAGYGPAKPVATNDTPEGRAANRRITIEVIKGAGSG